jgi:riboflavin synthase
MFTGIIEGRGTIKGLRPAGKGKRFVIDADIPLDEVKLGDSIAVSGACLTAVVIQGRRFEADVSPETLSATIFGKAKVGDRLNLERALRMADRIDGHLVSGHVDGVGTLAQRETSGNAILVTISVPESLTRYMIKKGSVAVDGISLTINNVAHQRFDVSVIPHTAQSTTIGFKKIGEAVNIETDMIGKYVERFMGDTSTPEAEGGVKKRSLDRDFLGKSGFL